MAASGNFDTKPYEVRYLTFEWTLESQSISDNSSTISWSIKGAGGSSERYYRTGNFKVIIDGETVYQYDGSIKLKHQVVASGTKTIRHGLDGKKNFTASASAGIYAYQSNNSTGSGSWDLTQIPRQATLTSARNFNDEENPSIYYSNPAGDVVTRLQACILTSNEQDIIVPYRDIPKADGVYTFDLNEGERNALRIYSKNSNTSTVNFRILTSIGSQTFYSTMSKTLTIVNALPTLNPEAHDIKTESIALTGNADNFIRYISDVHVATNANGCKGATIVRQSITNSGVTINDGFGVFYGVQGGSTTFSVTDSRGNTTVKTIVNVCYPYVIPSVSITDSKLSADGSMTVEFTGNVYKGDFGISVNKNLACYRYRERGSAWPEEWMPVSDLIRFGPNGTYSVDCFINGLDYTKSYVIQVAIEDSIYRRQSNEKVVVSTPVFSWGKDFFTFHVPTVSGQIYSLGGIPKSNVIPDGSDFNKYTEPGVYCVSQSSSMSSISNIPPVHNAGKLVVESSLGDAKPGGPSSYLKQRFIPCASGTGSWIRGAMTGDTPGLWAWSEWVLDLTSGDTDYIVSQGVSGMWRYRKWSSGRAECWGTKTLENLSCTSSWGSLYETPLTSSYPYPFTFIDLPIEYKSVGRSGGAGAMIENGADNTLSSTGTVCFVRPNQTIFSRIDLNFYVVGEWR